jgi:hypothetical protein
LRSTTTVEDAVQWSPDTLYKILHSYTKKTADHDVIRRRMNQWFCKVRTYASGVPSGLTSARGVPEASAVSF